MNKNKHFIIIDDDSVNNMVCNMVISHALPGATVKTFTEPTVALSKVEAEMEQFKDDKIIVFLDINMPEMSGWEFLQALEKTHDLSENRYMIFMASSSVNPEDKLKAMQNPHIVDFIEKPLTKEIVLHLSENYLVPKH